MWIILASLGLVATAIAGSNSKEKYGQDTSDDPLDDLDDLLPPTSDTTSDAASALVKEVSPYKVGYDIRTGVDRATGQTYTRVVLTTGNPIKLIEQVSGRALGIAKQYGVSVDISELREQPNELHFVFSQGPVPSTSYGGKQTANSRSRYGTLPPPSMASAPAASVLQSAALAQPGSWTQRNVMQQGAQSSWQRRVAGTATEADFAVLRAARPGITSSLSGPISPGWSKSPWGSGSIDFSEPDDLDELDDLLADDD